MLNGLRFYFHSTLNIRHSTFNIEVLRRRVQNPAMRKLLFVLLLLTVPSFAAPPAFAPDRKPGEGEGPFTRVIIRGATLVDGTGAPPIGPVDIVIEGNRIREVRSVGFPKVPIKPESRPKDAVKEIDGTGLWVLPGFVDMHGHSGGEEQGTPA